MAEAGAPIPPESRCASCGSRLLPNLALANWFWGKRCQMCRARYCRTCVNRYVRVGYERSTQVVLHELAHNELMAADLDDVAVHAPLGQYEPNARYGRLRPDGAAFVAGDEVFATATEAAAETFARYVLMPDALTAGRREWVERTATRVGAGWLEMADLYRSSGSLFDGGNNMFSTVYECGFCGHLWGEMDAGW